MKFVSGTVVMIYNLGRHWPSKLCSRAAICLSLAVFIPTRTLHVFGLQDRRGSNSKSAFMSLS